MQAMLDEGVATRRGIMCAHREPAYSGLPRPHQLAESECAQDCCVLLPLYVQMTEDDQDRGGVASRRACWSHAPKPAAQPPRVPEDQPDLAVLGHEALRPAPGAEGR